MRRRYQQDNRAPEATMRTASAFAFFIATLPLTPGLAEQAAPSKPPVPSYIVADRGGAEQMLGAARADEVFSDRFTALRKRLIAASLRANPASGCAQPPDFTLELVAPIEASAETAAWQERYLIKCKPDVQRSFLLISAKGGMKTAELAPGGTIADMTLQRDVLQGVMAATVGRVSAKCKDVQIRDTRVTSLTSISQPWTEVWTLGACGTPIDVEVHFTPSPKGGTDWSVQVGK
jgi:hypothetical protein